MGIVAAVGLASNFAAIRSLVTTGIQKGHMRLDLSNILNMLNATPDQRVETEIHFKGRKSAMRRSNIFSMRNRINVNANGKLLITGEYLVLAGATA